jgi:hypothetical protein
MMQRGIQSIRTDLRLSWLDGSSRIFLFMPLAFLALLHLAIPPLLAAYPQVAPYKALILDGIVFQGGLLFGFLSGFLLLDDKDLGTMQVHRIEPIGLNTYLALKMAFPFLITLAYAWIALATNPILPMTLPQTLASGLLFAGMSPMLALLVSALGKNKVQGLTFFKAVDLLLIIPFLAFFLPEAYRPLFVWLPTYWIFDSLMQLSMGDFAQFGLDFGIGLLLLATWVLFAGWLFKRRLE